MSREHIDTIRARLMAVLVRPGLPAAGDTARLMLRILDWWRAR